MEVPIPIVGPSSKTYSEHQSARLINGYLEMGDADAKAPVAILGTPGIEVFYELTGPVRALYVLDGRLFIVAGAGIYEGYPDRTTRLWASLSTISGDVGISDNSGKLIFGDGTGFFVLDLSDGSLSQVTIEDTDILVGTWSAYIDGTTLYMQRDTGQTWYSDINDPLTVGGLSFGAAEGSPDKNVHIAVLNREIIISQTGSIEYWASTGDADDPFARVGGGFVEGGALTPFVKADNSLFWIDRDESGQGIVRRLQGYEGARVSNHAVEKAIREFTGTFEQPWSYVEEGHTFVCFNFDTTWAFDAATGQWHERSWTNPSTGVFERQRQHCHAFCFGSHFVGDYENGNVYRQALGIYSDGDDPLVLRRETPHSFGGRAYIVDELEIYMETGVGLETGQGSDPVAMLQYSTDGGRNWSNELTVSIGKIGETYTRVRFQRLGMGRDWVFRFSVSDPVRRVITGAKATVRPAR